MKTASTQISELVRSKALSALPSRNSPEPVIDALVRLGVGPAHIARCLGVTQPFVSAALAGRKSLSVWRVEQLLALLTEALDEAAVILRQLREWRGPAFEAVVDQVAQHIAHLGASEQEQLLTTESFVAVVAEATDKAFSEGIAAHDYAEIYFMTEEIMLER